jgi:ferredoxin--NADP+ reductase
VIGTNKKDATETVERLIADARAGALGHAGDPAAIEALLAERGVVVVTQEGWEAIDAAEKSAGEPHSRPRIKLAEWDTLLAAAGLDRAAS